MLLPKKIVSTVFCVLIQHSCRHSQLDQGTDLARNQYELLK